MKTDKLYSLFDEAMEEFNNVRSLFSVDAQEDIFTMINRLKLTTEYKERVMTQDETPSHPGTPNCDGFITREDAYQHFKRRLIKEFGFDKMIACVDRNRMLERILNISLSELRFTQKIQGVFRSENLFVIKDILSYPISRMKKHKGFSVGYVGGINRNVESFLDGKKTSIDELEQYIENKNIIQVGEG